ncbi:MAG TPA: rhodanese-like domain-containing protein [Cyclobacteriaceae bacterium]|nr:rhodanese-like domain-containing protein [Cyclobacteriaceae bacterium]
MFNLFSGATKSFEELDGIEFKTKFNSTKNAVLLDVRTPGEFQSGHIKGAKNIDFYSSDFRDKVNQLDKDKEYFLYCRSGARSASACNMMAKAGFKVYNLDGGIGEWPR